MDNNPFTYSYIYTTICNIFILTLSFFILYKAEPSVMEVWVFRKFPVKSYGNQKKADKIKYSQQNYQSNAFKDFKSKKKLKVLKFNLPITWKKSQQNISLKDTV